MDAGVKLSPAVRGGRVNRIPLIAWTRPYCLVSAREFKCTGVILPLRDRAGNFVAFRSGDGDGELVFFVRDNGASFDMRHRRMLFDPVPREPSSSAPRGGAIRLAHVQRIIQRHGGRLWTEAVPDGGATFYFSLPGELPEPPCTPTPQ